MHGGEKGFSKLRFRWQRRPLPWRSTTKHRRRGPTRARPPSPAPATWPARSRSTAHRDIVDITDRPTSENRQPYLLPYRPPGTRKTSTILAVARKLYGEQYHNMILELNASNDRRIDVVRQQIQDFASARSLSFGYRLNFACNDKLQLGKLISTFTDAHSALVAAAR